jgi:hypothetical protein
MRQYFAAKTIYAEAIIGPGAGIGPEYWLDPVKGNNSNSGESWKAPWKTLEYAESKLKGGINETLYFRPSAATATGAGSANALSAALTWDKSFTHLVGVAPLGGTGNRCRITAASTLTDAALVTISGLGCVFKNIAINYGVASAAALYAGSVTGSRNYFENVRFAGIMNDTQDAADAGSLYITGSENEFNKCYIGNTTIGRGTATNTEIYFIGNNVSQRNVFNDCSIMCRADATDHTFVKKGDTGNQDWTEFNRCRFINSPVLQQTNITMLSAFTVPEGTNTANFFLTDCMMAGCADWEVGNRKSVYIFNSAAATAANDGLAFAIV